MKKQILFSFFICLLTTIGVAQTAQDWIQKAQQANEAKLVAIIVLSVRLFVRSFAPRSFPFDEFVCLSQISGQVP